MSSMGKYDASDGDDDDNCPDGEMVMGARNYNVLCEFRGLGLHIIPVSI